MLHVGGPNFAFSNFVFSKRVVFSFGGVPVTNNGAEDVQMLGELAAGKKESGAAKVNVLGDVVFPNVRQSSRAVPKSKMGLSDWRSSPPTAAAHKLGKGVGGEVGSENVERVGGVASRVALLGGVCAPVVVVVVASWVEDRIVCRERKECGRENPA